MENKVDSERYIVRHINGSVVTVYFADRRNDQLEKDIINSLFDCFDKRVKSICYKG